MNSKIINTIKIFIPPILLKFLKSNNKYGWSGNYANWDEAKKKCSGYESKDILERCKNSSLKVKKGEAIFERDSVLFYEPSYSWPTLSGLLLCLTEKNKKINVLDFGGSLGSSYFQNLTFLSLISNLSLSWNIVEQQHFVECGKKYFEDENLKFYLTIEKYLLIEWPDILLLSSVLQYLEKPFEQLDKFFSLGIEYIVIDRTAFTETSNDTILIQKVPSNIYKASYPTWAFNEKKFLTQIQKKYDVILNYHNTDQSNLKSMYFKGFILKLKK